MPPLPEGFAGDLFAIAVRFVTNLQSCCSFGRLVRFNRTSPEMLDVRSTFPR
jgi:hypothetical protein